MKPQKLRPHLHVYSGGQWRHHIAGSGVDVAVASSNHFTYFLGGGAHEDENLEGLEIILVLHLELHRMGFFDIFQH